MSVQRQLKETKTKEPALPLTEKMKATAEMQALKSSVKDETAFVVGWERCLKYIIDDAQKKIIKHSEKELKAFKGQDVNALADDVKIRYETKIATCREIHNLLQKYVEEEDEE